MDKETIKQLEREWNSCRHSMRGMKGFVACCIYCNKSLDEMWECWLRKFHTLLQERAEVAREKKKDDICFQNNEPGMHYECDCIEKDSFNSGIDSTISIFLEGK